MSDRPQPIRRESRLQHQDPGLQPERTDMAWTRTALAYALCAAVLLRWAWVLGPMVLLLVLGLLAVSLTVALTQDRRYRRLVHSIVAEQAPANLGGVLLMSGALVLFGISAIVLVLLG
ncbi:DUF202 domain-containing protein [Corynebacterium sp. A21]|uniref:DUF202 domain-containing protein n=1 Tax=Corynebacterium sp. A21 TaxID=3457318 RepID=UPI003FD11CC2